MVFSLPARFHLVCPCYSHMVPHNPQLQPEKPAYGFSSLSSPVGRIACAPVELDERIRLGNELGRLKSFGRVRFDACWRKIVWITSSRLRGCHGWSFCTTTIIVLGNVTLLFSEKKRSLTKCNCFFHLTRPVSFSIDSYRLVWTGLLPVNHVHLISMIVWLN